VTPGGSFNSLSDAVNAGLVRGCPPFIDGVDLFGFFNDIKQTEAQRYADVEITHGRVAMLAALGFLVGEQVEGSSFLFDAQITGPAIDHFQQVPGIAWGLIGAAIFVTEASRVQIAWQDPFMASELFLLKPDHVPGDYGFDPLGLTKRQGRRVARRHEDEGAEQRPSRDDRHQRHGRSGARAESELVARGLRRGCRRARRATTAGAVVRERGERSGVRGGVRGGGKSRRFRRFVRSVLIVFDARRDASSNGLSRERRPHQRD
jgi:hypothetical protein